MDPILFQEFADIAYRRAGIRLTPGKESLVGARIAKRIRVLGLSGANEYLEHLLENEDGDELIQFLDVISTNFTSFFREADHFELLAGYVQDWAQEGRSRMRFWSAASSSGEEPYTMAITAANVLSDTSVNWRILATDISTRILSKAEEGIYPASSLKTIPKHLRTKYFQLVGPRGHHNDPPYKLHDALRKHVTFKRLNLSTPPFPMRGPLDIVMCRNVMIYFDQKVRQKLVSAIEELMSPDGVFFIGHAETLNGLNTRFRPLQPSVYALSDTAKKKLATATHHKGHTR